MPDDRELEQADPEIEAHRRQAELQRAMFKRAVESMGESLRDFGMLLIQGWREDNGGLRGNVAAGLERTACYLRGEHYDPQVAPHNIDIRKGG